MLCAVPIWVAFPILMSVFQHGYLLVRQHVLPDWMREGKSGYLPLQFTYACAMIASFMGHVHVVLIPAL